MFRLISWFLIWTASASGTAVQSYRAYQRGSKRECFWSAVTAILSITASTAIN